MPDSNLSEADPWGIPLEEPGSDSDRPDELSDEKTVEAEPVVTPDEPDEAWPSSGIEASSSVEPIPTTQVDEEPEAPLSAPTDSDENSQDVETTDLPPDSDDQQLFPSQEHLEEAPSDDSDRLSEPAVARSEIAELTRALAGQGVAPKSEPDARRQDVADSPEDPPSDGGKEDDPSGAVEPDDKWATLPEPPVSPLRSMLAGAVADIHAPRPDETLPSETMPEEEPTEPLIGEEGASIETAPTPETAEAETPTGDGGGLSRMLAAAQTVFGDGEQVEDEMPTLATEDLPEDLPSWAVADDDDVVDHFKGLEGPSGSPQPPDSQDPDSESQDPTSVDETEEPVEVTKGEAESAFGASESDQEIVPPEDIKGAIEQLGGEAAEDAVEMLAPGDIENDDQQGQAEPSIEGEGASLFDLGTTSPPLEVDSSDEEPAGGATTPIFVTDEPDLDDPDDSDTFSPELASINTIAERLSAHDPDAVSNHDDEEFDGAEDTDPSKDGQDATPDSEAADDTGETLEFDDPWLSVVDMAQDDAAQDDAGDWNADDHAASTEDAIDVPISSLPVPSVYKELEGLPPTHRPGPGFELADVANTADAHWGERWDESAQGWIETDDGDTVWRPIVSTSDALESWSIETYLGVVTGDAPFDATGLADLPSARTLALEKAIAEAITRGAHAVTGVQFEVHAVGDSAVVTASGTAVTLRSST